MQAPKELTLSVLEDVRRRIIRRISRSVSQHAGKRCKAPRRIYIAFGEHPAAGVCVCVCSSKLDSSGLVVLLLRFLFAYMVMGVFVRLLACLPIRVSLCFFGWLLVSMCACVFFGTLRHIFVSYSHFGRLFCALLALWGALRLHCNAWGSTLPPLVTYFCMFFRTWWDLGAQFVDLWVRLGTFGVHFNVFLWLCGRILGPFFGFSGYASKKNQKRREKRS